MLAVLAERIEKSWYQQPWFNIWLLPLSLLFFIISHLRRIILTRVNPAKPVSDIPVVVIGNIAVGGTGKTPLTCTLVDLLAQQGVKVGIISRGYGSKAPHYPFLVTGRESADISGDEPKLLAQRLGCPVVIGSDRNRSILMLSQHHDVDLILCDDGLQNYAMHRDYEFVVIDAKRQLGNGWLLPAGPLREGAWRLKTVDQLLINGDSNSMLIEAECWVNAKTGVEQPLDYFSEVSELKAVCGIGNPQRFWDTLEALQVTADCKNFADHHAFSADDLPQGTVLMTEKDWVKCIDFATQEHWYLKVRAKLQKELQQKIVNELVVLASSRKKKQGI